MAAFRRLSFSWTTLYSNVSTGDGIFIPTTGWMQAADVGKVRCTWEQANEMAANMIGKPGYQTANVENAPDAGVVIGTDYQQGNGVKYGTVMTDVNSATQAKALVRLGIWVKLPSGSTETSVRVAGSFDIQEP